MQHTQNQKSRGFTLIELLVVIAIIGVLAAVGMVSYSVAGKGARDARRKTDIETIRQALVMYRSEFGCYPDDGMGMDAVLNTLKDASYLSNPLPVDPKNTGLFVYNYDTSKYSSVANCPPGETGSMGFHLSATLEKTPPPQYEVTSP